MLRAERDHLRITQGQVGKLLHLSDDAFGHYERGERQPGLATAIGLEFVFGKSLADLYPGVARAVAEQMIPVLQKLSVAIEWDEQSHPTATEALRAIGDRLSGLMPDA